MANPAATDLPVPRAGLVRRLALACALLGVLAAATVGALTLAITQVQHSAADERRARDVLVRTVAIDRHLLDLDVQRALDPARFAQARRALPELLLSLQTDLRQDRTSARALTRLRRGTDAYLDAHALPAAYGRGSDRAAAAAAHRAVRRDVTALITRQQATARDAERAALARGRRLQLVAFVGLLGVLWSLAGLARWLRTQVGSAIDRHRADADAALAASEEQAAQHWQILEAAHDAFVGMDDEGRVTGWNRQAMLMFGWTAEEAVGKRVSELIVPPRLRDAHTEGLSRFLRTGVATVINQRVELEATTQDGRSLPVELTISTTSTSPPRFSAFIRDVSVRRAHEELQRATTRRLERVVVAQRRLTDERGSTEETMERICEVAAELTGAEGAVIEVLEGDELVYRGGTGSAAGTVGTVVSVHGSLAGLAARTAEALLCEDTSQDPRVDGEVCRRTGVGSMVVVPLLHAQRVTAVLKVTSTEAHAFDHDDLATLQLLSGTLGSALGRSRAIRQTAAHEAVSSAIAGAPDVEAGLQAALGALGRSLGWDAAAYWAPSSATTLLCRAAWAEDPDADGAFLTDAAERRIPVGQGTIGAAWTTGAPVWFREPELAELPRARVFDALGVRTAVALPIGDLGVIELLAKDVRNVDDETLATVERLAALLEHYLARGDAERKVTEEARNLRTVLDVARCMADARTTEDVHRLLLDTIADASDPAMVYLFERDDDALVRVAAHGDVDLGPSLALRGSSSAAATVALTGQPLFIADTATSSVVDQHVREHLGVSSATVQPLVIDGRTSAVLAVGWQRRLDEDDPAVAAIQLLAVEAAGALDRLALVKRLDEAARTDALTGLANRRSWDEQLPLALARSARAEATLCVAVLDLDRFKAYNDTHGHQAGDHLLKHTAALWSGELRSTDLLARYGGEEFAIVLPGCDLAHAEALLDRLRRSVPLQQSCSIGVAAWDGSELPERLVARADEALYEAKRTGRDRVCLAG